MIGLEFLSTRALLYELIKSQRKSPADRLPWRTIRKNAVLKLRDARSGMRAGPIRAPTKGSYGDLYKNITKRPRGTWVR